MSRGEDLFKVIYGISCMHQPSSATIPPFVLKVLAPENGLSELQILFHTIDNEPHFQQVKELVKQPNGSYIAGVEEDAEKSPGTGRRSEPILMSS